MRFSIGPLLGSILGVEIWTVFVENPKISKNSVFRGPGSPRSIFDDFCHFGPPHGKHYKMSFLASFWVNL
jgi:hypothetical protein